MTAFDSHTNFANSLVAIAPSPANSGTTLSVSAGDGSGKFTGIPPYNCTVTNPNGQQEIIRVTAISTDQMTIVRAQEGSTAIPIGVGATIVNSESAKVLTDVENAILALAQQGQGTNTFDIRYFGAKCDGVTDDTAAWTAALTAAGAVANTGAAPYNSGGAMVIMPAGISVVTGIVLPNHVWIRGAGYKNSWLYLKNGSNTSVVSSFVSPDGIQGNAYDCGVIDIAINGNASHQTGTSHGVTFVTNPVNSESSVDSSRESEFDTHHTVQNVRIMNCLSNGFNQVGRSECQLHNVFCFNNKGYGFAPSYDTRMTACSAGSNSLHGFYLAHGSCALSACKSFENGSNAAPAAGFVITGIAQVTLSGCIAQNNYAQGLLITNANAISFQGDIDSNNFGSSNTQGQYAGIEINNSSYCVISAATGQGYQSVGLVGNQGWALRVNGGSNYNDIVITQYNQPTYTALGMLSSDSVLLNNRIYTNGAAGSPGV